ncbi:zinc finger protein 541-like [Pezoporus occidentalis]|uniref:zinc finger protein 541-like n=1 Tax=Pezoporus occidentalis TaxID=407982 RepID=UPI002F91A6A2
MHCLHEARGNVLEALELLRQGGPQPNQDHPLAGYHYTGMDTWTPLEQQLFDIAFRKHNTDFHKLQQEVKPLDAFVVRVCLQGLPPASPSQTASLLLTTDSN